MTTIHALLHALSHRDRARPRPEPANILPAAAQQKLIDAAFSPREIRRFVIDETIQEVKRDYPRFFKPEQDE